MSCNLVFVDRRGHERRLEQDSSPEVALSAEEKKRRKHVERRDRSRTIVDDYEAYMRKQLGKADFTEPARKPTEEV